MKMVVFLVLLSLLGVGTSLKCNYCLEVSSIGSANERIEDFEQGLDSIFTTLA